MSGLMSASRRDTSRRSGVAERVYQELRERILDGRYRPNQHLVETDVADELDSSRTPIRQGLQRLEIEGLVVSSRSGWIVHEHTLHDIEGIYDVRIPLEGYACGLAAVRGTSAEHDELLRLHEESKAHLAPSDREAYVRTHDALHETILQATQTDVLADAVRSYRSHPYNRRVAHMYSDEEMRISIESHEELVAAIRSRDSEAAERIGRHHLELSRDVTLDRMRRMV